MGRVIRLKQEDLDGYLEAALEKLRPPPRQPFSGPSGSGGGDDHGDCAGEVVHADRDYADEDEGEKEAGRGDAQWPGTG